ncbi:MAG: hypothetical protein WC849_00740 [Candidatus Paceibacterota bacterium]
MKTNMFFILVLVFFCGCGSSITKENEKTQIVERIFMHEPTEYSFMYFKPNTNELKTATYGIESEYLKIISDVKPENKPWFYYAEFNGHNQPSYRVLIIHIRNVSDIQGGGWNHGKFGRGQTVVIQ